MPTAADIAFDEKPWGFSFEQESGRPLKSIPQILLERRATSHFMPDEVPPEVLETILRFGAQAPSGFNLQPWRFIVVRDAEGRKKLQHAAFDQQKISEAPVVIIALGMKDEWKKYAEEIFEEGMRHGIGSPEKVPAQKKSALEFLATQPMNVWVNRHTMIAFTVMMLVAEAYGWNTAPMEGFDPVAVRAAFNIPSEAEIVALLAIGRAKEPEKPYPGRLALENIFYSENYGRPWKTS